MANYQWKPLTDEKKFEDLINDLCSAKYSLEFQIYGRKGQKQYGIDGFASIKENEYILYQCKNKDISRSSKIIKNELLKDLETETNAMLREFIEEKSYIVKKFIFAHSWKRDKDLQNKANELNSNVIIWSWDEISDILEEYQDIAEKYYPKSIKKLFHSDIHQKNIEMNIDDGLTGIGNMNGGIFNQTINNHSSKQVNLTKKELKTQRKKEEKSLFFSIKKSNENYIERKIDTIIYNKIFEKKSSILFIQAQGGSGKSTLLKKISKTNNRPTLFIHLNDKIDINAIDLFLYKSKIYNCPKFESKLDEIFLRKENNQKNLFGEYELLEALMEDFSKHGVFIVDNFEKNKNSQIKSRVEFSNTIKFSKTDKFYRFRDYLEKLIHHFLHKTTFIIAGRNRLSDIKEDKGEDRFLDLDEIKELSIEKFSIIDIEKYIQNSGLKHPSNKQLKQIEKITNGNALLIYLLIKVAKEYKSWIEFDYDEMKKVLLEDKNYGLHYYLTKRILSHTHIKDIWKLVIPRNLHLEIESILFNEKNIFNSLVDVGLTYRGEGKERNFYTLHDDVYNAIEAHAKKELQGNKLSWYDNDKVQNIHQKLKKFYQINKDKFSNYRFDICYHNMMMKQNFELNFNRDRKAFIQSFLGAIFITYKQKISFCKEFHKVDENNIRQTIIKIEEEEIKGSLSRMSKELYQECSAYVSQGISEDGIYVVEFLESLLSKYQKQQDLFQIYSFLGQAYQNKQEYEKARKVYVEAVKRGLEDEDFFYLLIGNTYYYQNNNQKALFNYKLSAKINQKRDETFNNIGAVYYRMGEYDKAFEFYKKAIDIKPTDSNYMNIAIMFYEKAKYDIAIELYQKAISLNPYNEWAYINMANCYRDKRPPNYKEAFEIYKEASEINPENEYIYNHSGILLFKKKQYKDAISAYQMAIDRNPKNEWFYRNIGETYYKLENADKAIEYYNKAITINPKESNFYNDIGLVFILNKLYSKAIDFFQKAIKIDSNDFILYNNLADAYTRNKEYNNAIYSYEKSLKIKEDFLAQFNSAKVYMKKKDYVSAIKLYNQLLDSYPIHRNSIYRELYICYFYNHDYILMFKTIVVLKYNRHKDRQYYKRKQRRENTEKIIKWVEKTFNISRKKLEIIGIILGVIINIGLYWGLYILISRLS